MRNDLEKEVTQCGKINKTATGSVQEKRHGGLGGKHQQRTEQQTYLNDVSEIDLTVSSLRGGSGKREELKIALKCI